MYIFTVCDDDAVTRSQLEGMIRLYASSHNENIKINSFGSGEELVNNFPSDTNVLLLDIKMKELSGINAARELRQRNINIPILFITSMTQYALECYDVHAFGFIKKPIHYSQLEWQLDDLFKMMNISSGMELTIQNGATIMVLKSFDILYAESFRHVVHIHTANGGNVICSTPLNVLEEKLGDCGFFRIHKSFLINLQKIKRIEQSSVIIENNEELPLSKYRRNEFLIAFAKSKEYIQ